MATIMLDGQTTIYPPFFALGYQGDDISLHAEQKIITWAQNVIEGYKGIKGAVINLLIFTQNTPCDKPGGCMSKLTSNTWLNTLYTATVPGGGAAQVNLAVWETNTKDPSNISSEVSVCAGSTNGVTTESNC